MFRCPTSLTMSHGPKGRGRQQESREKRDGPQHPIHEGCKIDFGPFASCHSGGRSTQEEGRRGGGGVLNLENGENREHLAQEKLDGSQEDTCVQSWEAWDQPPICPPPSSTPGGHPPLYAHCKKRKCIKEIAGRGHMRTMVKSRPPLYVGGGTQLCTYVVPPRGRGGNGEGNGWGNVTGQGGADDDLVIRLALAGVGRMKLVI